MVNLKKVGIVGIGAVGSTVAFALMMKGFYNEIVLVDRNKDKAEGEAMDISHGLAYASPTKIYSGDYADLADASLIVVTAGAAQKEGETRLDLIQKNTAIMKSVMGQIVAVRPQGMILIVSNPVDVLTHVALKVSGFPRSRVFGSGTVLDTARLKYLLSQRLKVDTRNIHAVILGEHGDSEFAAYSFANVSGMPLEEFCELRGFLDHPREQEKIYEEVRDSAYEIIRKKGATYYGIALSVCRICECLVKDEHSMLPISTELEGEYGLEGLALSVPSLLSSSGVEKVLELPLSAEEKNKLLSSGKRLKEVISTLDL
jgi:L-lactate dehydrogenase